jgi:PREDICTED: similar to choline/ethanolamine kinase
MKHQSDFINLICRKIALIHSLTVPIPKDPNFILDLSLKFHDVANEDLEQRLSELEPEELEFFGSLLSLDIKKEVEWLKQIAPKIQSRSVFCHNDLKFGNIGLRKDREKLEDRLFIFDYENCSYGYRGYEFALFISWYNFEINVENVSDHSKPPSQDLIDQIINNYLEEWKKLSKNFDSAIDNRDHFRMEIDFCLLMMQILYSCVLLKRIKKASMYYIKVSDNTSLIF